MSGSTEVGSRPDSLPFQGQEHSQKLLSFENFRAPYINWGGFFSWQLVATFSDWPRLKLAVPCRILVFDPIGRTSFLTAVLRGSTRLSGH
jgi:hypothetical protein